MFLDVVIIHSHHLERSDGNQLKETAKESDRKDGSVKEPESCRALENHRMAACSILENRTAPPIDFTLNISLPVGPEWYTRQSVKFKG